MQKDRQDPITLFITWTTYGSWLPGGSKGWTKWKSGIQQPQQLLEDWCRGRMKEDVVVLNGAHRKIVENVIRDHSRIRNWNLHAVSARSNHVHVVVTVIPRQGNREYRAADGIKRVRDELKANATRVLRRCANPLHNNKIWTTGGDIQFIDSEDDLDRVVIYAKEAQDRMNRGK